jgi:hypothetical protein
MVAHPVRPAASGQVHIFVHSKITGLTFRSASVTLESHNQWEMTMTTDPLEALRLLPKPRFIHSLAGEYRLDQPRVEIGVAASALARIVTAEWAAEFGPAPAIQTGSASGYYFNIGQPGTTESEAARHPERFSLEVTERGISARAETAAGLLYAWQTLKQILRSNASRIPCLRIADWPDLRWRVYHLDLKGTRRTLANLKAILPSLAEARINAVLAEYEDYVRLDRHPSLAVPQALSKAEVREWIQAAKDYNITVIPLVQCLGHLQYVLRQPKYAHLQEKPGDPSEACANHPETWPLIRDFLDEMMDLHEGLPLFHVGLDETFHIGTCPRCQAALGRKPRMSLYVEWVNRCCRHVRERGFTPIVWGDIVSTHFDSPVIAELDRTAYYIDWGYQQTGSLFPTLLTLHRNAISREWFQRPNGEIAEMPRLGYGPGKQIFEDLPVAARERLHPFLDNPEFPRKFPSDVSLAMLAKTGVKSGSVSGIRVSFHGSVAPRFITGQLNTIAAANACKQHGAEVVIGSSWSRGHSLAGMNAHPELDWYGILTLGACGWSAFDLADLRDFDRRFAWQFFGLQDGTIGDLYFQFERSSMRVDHSMENYLSHILEELARLQPVARRNPERLELFRTVCEVQNLRFKAQFAVLEMEYFYALWDRVPQAFKDRMKRDIEAVAAEMDRSKLEVASRYARTIIEEDARELAATQFDFFRDQMLLQAGRQFPETAR